MQKHQEQAFENQKQLGGVPPSKGDKKYVLSMV